MNNPLDEKGEEKSVDSVEGLVIAPGHPEGRERIREQDRFLPTANVVKVMKRALPQKAKIAKEAKQCMQECVSEFVSFITSEANDHCLSEKRKTITGDDVLWAMNALGFDNYIEPLRLYLTKYHEMEKDSSAKRRIKIPGVSDSFSELEPLKEGEDHESDLENPDNPDLDSVK